MIERVQVNGDPLTLVFPKNIIEHLGLKSGDELEIAIVDRTLIIQPVDEAERAKKFQEARDKVFTKYDEAFEALATKAS